MLAVAFVSVSKAPWEMHLLGLGQPWASTVTIQRVIKNGAIFRWVTTSEYPLFSVLFLYIFILSIQMTISLKHPPVKCNYSAFP